MLILNKCILLPLIRGGVGVKKMIVIAVILLTEVLMISCGAAENRGVLQGRLIETYEVAGEKPFISTYADGTYYSMCTEYGARIYSLSVSDTLGELRPVYKTESVDILNVEANDRYATWGELHVRGDSTDIMIYNRDDGSIKPVHSMKKLPDKEDVIMLQYPLSKLYEDSVFFVERGEDGIGTSIIQHCMTDQTEKTLYSFTEFYGYQPVLQVCGNHLASVIDADDEKVGILLVNLLTKEQTVVRLSDDIDRVFAIDYDAAQDDLYIYYHSKKAKKEIIGVYSVGSEGLREVYTFSNRECLANDEIKKQGKYLIWNHYNKPKSETTELTSLYSLMVYDTEKERLYEFENGFDYFIKDEVLYSYNFGFDRVNELYEVRLP